MFKIFYLENCGYSLKALNILHKYDLVNKLDEIKSGIDELEVQDLDLELIPPSYTSYPKILYMDKTKYFIGGYDELEKLINLVTTPTILNCKEIPSQRFIDKKITCKILLELTNKIK
jgi:glutaredoxin-related protein